MYEGLGVFDDPVTQIGCMPTFPPDGEETGNAGKAKAKGSLRRANSTPSLKTRLTLQKRAAQSPLHRMVTISASQTQLREETFHAASHLSWLSSFFMKSTMEEDESRKAISKI